MSLLEEESSTPKSAALTPLEASMVRFFVDLAQGFSLPKSIGEIFGLIFASPRPIAFDEVVARLGISPGSASSGLKFLQRMNAVRTVYVERDRRTFYEPEMSLKRLFTGLLNETIMPHLRSSADHLVEIEHALKSLPQQEATAVGERIAHLVYWRKRAAELAPFFVSLVGRK